VALPSLFVPSTSHSTTLIFAALAVKSGEIFGVQATCFSTVSLRSHLFLCRLLAGSRPSFPSPDDSNQLQPPQIMQMHHAQNSSLLVHDDHASDAALLHQRQSFTRKHFWANSLRIARQAICQLHVHHRAT